MGEDTTSNRSEDPPQLGGTGKTSSPISHQHKIYPTIFTREPILRKRTTAPDVDTGERYRGRRHLVNRPTGPKLGTARRILNYDDHHEQSSSEQTFALVRSRPRDLAVAGKTQELKGGRPGCGALKKNGMRRMATHSVILDRLNN